MQDNQFNSLTKKDFLITLILMLAVFTGLLMELKQPGVTWDEASPNFPAAKKQAEWIKGLFSIDNPFSKDTIDAYWKSTSDHPSLPRTIAAVSYLIFSPYMDEIIAFRIPSALKFSILASSIFLFLRFFLPVMPSLAGALSIVLMPRIFGEAHIFSLDVPIMCWWFWTSAIGFCVIEKNWSPWWFGLAYSITFTTKLHSVFLPFPLLAWAVLQCWGTREKWIRLIKACGWTLLTPVFYILLQPWLWHDTWVRFTERFFHYSAKTTVHPIPLYYLGQLYANNTPWHYPLVMILFTLPVFILLLFLVGILYLLWNKKGHEDVLQYGRWKSGIHLFFIFIAAVPPMLLLLPFAQGYDGCRLFLPCFPFIAGIIGFGYFWLSEMITNKIPARIVHTVLFLLLCVPSFLTFTQIRPYYLAYYNELAGGADGAKRLGMESTYWCDGLTLGMLDEINRIVGPNKTMRPLSMPDEVIDYYKQRGWLRSDINHTAEPPYDFHLLQCRQGMFTRAEWFFYTQRKPLAVVKVGKTPLYALYGPM